MLRIVFGSYQATLYEALSERKVLLLQRDSGEGFVSLRFYDTSERVFQITGFMISCSSEKLEGLVGLWFDQRLNHEARH